MQLTTIQKQKYAMIMFDTRKQQIKQQIDKLSVDELQTLRSLYAQKICYDIVNDESLRDQQVKYLLHEQYNPKQRSLWMSIFCCCYPEYNREQFQITTPIFLQKALYPLLFWKNKFFQIDEGNLQSYGNMWMLFTYYLVLLLASVLTAFYVDPINYTMQYDNVISCFAIVFIFKITQPLIHSGSIGCLGCEISNQEVLVLIIRKCMMLSSYSLTTYLLPTGFCIVPSIYWRVMLLVVGSLCRAIFLFRNYGTRLQARRYLLLVLLLIIQVLYIVVVYRSLFESASLGFGFTQGFSAVFGTTPTLQQQVQSQNPMGDNTNTHYYYSKNNHNLRHFPY